MQFDTTTVWRLNVIAEEESGALMRVLQHFQLRNVIPCRVVAQRVLTEEDGVAVLEIQIDVHASALARETLLVIAAKINQATTVLAVSVDSRAERS